MSSGLHFSAEALKNAGGTRMHSRSRHGPPMPASALPANVGRKPAVYASHTWSKLRLRGGRPAERPGGLTNTKGGEVPVCPQISHRGEGHPQPPAERRPQTLRFSAGGVPAKSRSVFHGVELLAVHPQPRAMHYAGVAPKCPAFFTPVWPVGIWKKSRGRTNWWLRVALGGLAGAHFET